MIEYKVVTKKRELNEKELNELGKQGWILCVIDKEINSREVNYNQWEDHEEPVYYFYRQSVPIQEYYKGENRKK